MKDRLKEIIILGVLVISLAGCATGSGRGASQELMTPDQITGKTLTGSNDKDQSLSMMMNMDNTLSYVEDGKTYSGTWEYDGTKDFMAYTLNWDAGGSPQGYLANITGSGEDVTIMGYWYLTDMNKRFYFSGKITE